MAEELREALEQAIAAEEAKMAGTDVPGQPAEPVSEPEPETEPAPAPEPAESAPAGPSEPAPGEKPPTEAKPAPGIVPPAQQPQAAGQEAEPEPRGHRVDRAPVSWKQGAREGWETLPLPVRQEIHRREFQIEKALQEQVPIRQELAQFHQAVAPYMARVQAFGVPAAQVVQSLFQADYLLSSAPKQQRAEFMAKLIKDYDIDVVALDNALVGAQQQQQQPDVQALIAQQVQQALAPMYQQQQMAAQRIQQQADITVEQMMYDPKYPLFEDVRQDMADLMEMATKRGQTMSLEEAYNRAVTFNPDYQQEQQRLSKSNAAQEANRKAQAALAASSSVGGKPASSGNGRFEGDGSLRGTIEAAFNNLRI